MGQVFHQLYYHLVWATKNREPQLAAAVRPYVLEAIQDRCHRLGCRVHALNAVDDHVHLALEIPPSRSISFVVGQVKGASSHAMNQFQPGSLHWQDGYGVVTFRHGELGKVVRYIDTQEERHRANALSPLLETWNGTEGEESDD